MDHGPLLLRRRKLLRRKNSMQRPLARCEGWGQSRGDMGMMKQLRHGESRRLKAQALPRIKIEQSRNHQTTQMRRGLQAWT